jgi:hypothetical protein
MPNLFVVGTQKNLNELADDLISARTGAATRDAALRAIVKANPSLDFDRLQRGAVVVVPTVEGVKRISEDPMTAAADDLVVRVRDGMQALAQAAEQAEAVRAQEKKETQDLFGSALVERISARVPELPINIESVRGTFKQDDVTARRALVDIRESLDTWAADLDILRGLL